MITLFPSSSTNFETNGVGSLRDAISCSVSEGRNSEYELELQYPITGSYYSEIFLRSIVFAKPNPYTEPQPFRIYNISKPINGIVTINAQHISYDLSGFPVSPFNATAVSNALTNMETASTIECPFTFETNMVKDGVLSIIKPVSIRSILGKEILDTYGGEYEFDKFSVKLHEQRGQNRGYSIRYGKNLIDIKQEENCAAVYTGVYPFWYSEKDGLVQLSEKTLNAPGTYDFVKIYPLDLSQLWTEPPTEDQIRTEANNFMTNTGIGIPKVSIDISFIQLSQSEEYKNISSLETVMLCDDVTVEFDKLGVSATAKCVKTVYNVLTNRYTSIVLGEVKSNIVSTIVDGRQVTKKIEETNTKFSKEIDTIKIGLANIDTALIGKANIADLEAGYAHLIEGHIDVAQIKEASITSAMIALATIDTANIKVGAITTALIKDAAIGTTQIADGSITDAKIVSLTANRITSGTLDASLIIVKNLKADSITAGSLTIDGNNLIHGSDFVDLTKWTVDANGWALDTTTKYDTSNTIKISRTGLGADVLRTITSEKVTLGSGQAIVVSAYTMSNSVATIDGGLAYLDIAFYNSSNTLLLHNYVVMKPTTDNVWKKFTASSTSPANTSYVVIRLMMWRNGTLWLARPMVQRGSVSSEWKLHTDEQISPGAIDNTKITTNTITGDRLVADSITAREIATRTITANEIVAGTITADEIATNTITALNIKSGEITSDKISALGITADKIIGGTLSLGGLNNISGLMSLKNSTANEILKLDQTGIEVMDINGNVIGSINEKGIKIKDGALYVADDFTGYNWGEQYTYESGTIYGADEITMRNRWTILNYMGTLYDGYSQGIGPWWGYIGMNQYYDDTGGYSDVGEFWPHPTISGDFITFNRRDYLEMQPNEVGKPFMTLDSDKINMFSERVNVNSALYVYQGLSVTGGDINLTSSIVLTNGTSIGIRNAANTAWFYPNNQNGHMHIKATADIFMDTSYLHLRPVDGSYETKLNTAGAGTLAITSSYGWVDIGPKNASYMHFNTSMPRYYFDHNVHVNGYLYQGPSYAERVWGGGDIAMAGG